MSNSIAPGSSADVNVKVTALTTNQNVPVTYKTIILKKNLVNGVNTLTQEMMSDENIKYVIKYDYVLGEDITVPANCMLEFDGGSLSNGTIIGQNTYLDCKDSCLYTVLDGSFKNREICAEWFGIKPGLDNTTSNNRVFNSYIIPSMENIATGTLSLRKANGVYFSTSLVFNGTYNIDFQTLLIYSGNFNSTAITVGNQLRQSNDKSIHIEDLRSSSTAYSKKETIPDYVGVCITNCKFCSINIGRIESFAYNLKFYAINTGCASNIVHIREIVGYYYTGIFLLSEGESAWLNENNFICGTIYPSIQNPYLQNRSCIGIYIKALNQSSNGNFFIKPNLEANPIAVKLYNARYNSFIGVRFENSDESIVEENNSNNNTILTNYSYNTKSVYLEQNNKTQYISDIVFRNLNILKEGGVISNDDKNSINFVTINKVNGIITPFGYSNALYNLIGVILDITSEDNLINIYSLSGIKPCIGFVGENGSLLKISENVEYYITQGHLFKTSETYILEGLTSTTPGFNYNIKINYENVKKVFVCCRYKYDTTYTKDLSVRGYGVSLCSDYTLDIENKILENNFKGLLVNFAAQEGYTLILNKDMVISGVFTLPSNMTIICNGGIIKGGTLNINRAKVLPNYNSLLNSQLTIQGYPAEGTIYFQNGRPTWSDGTQWVDATGIPV